GFPEYNNMKIVDALRQSGSRSANPNDSIGFGIPDMRKAFMILLKSFVTSSATASSTLCKVNLTWQSKDNAGMRYEIERKNPGQNTYTNVGQFTTSAQGYQVRNYDYTDSLVQVAAGTISYRIRQVVDTSASDFYADYIDTITVNSTIACIHTSINPVNPGMSEFILLPNPVMQELRIKLTTVNAIPQLHIRIYNSKGQDLLYKKSSKGSGTVIIPMSVQSLPAGKYYVSVYNETQLLGSRELIKL
ncbi:MAG: T9SS type A sorting domain-containing protein, partial [Flavisolibacter sp.]